jgi:catechol 2,3-dioxygenase-like lactoylglutathione lyase family enzyme
MSIRTLPESIPIATFSHVVLRTGKPKDSRAFYGQLLGMKSVIGGGGGGALSHDGEHHRIALFGTADIARQSGQGVHHVGWKAESLGDLLGNYKRLRDAGMKPYLCVHHSSTLSFHYTDPDGILVEVFINALTVDQAREHDESPSAKASPNGVPFDADDLLSRFEAGESVVSLLQQPTSTPQALNEMSQLFAAAHPGN